ncbi:MAG TPA: mechanosensitive ion channel family protein [Methylophilaceae bacterium]|nr:mechanosensitive ion channel family protein [Methylophilaceae bacterium]
MTDVFSDSSHWLTAHPEFHMLLGLLLLLSLAWLSNWVVKHILVRGVYRMLRATPVDKALARNPAIRRLANTVPALVLSLGIGLVPGLAPALVTVVQNVANAVIVLTLALAVTSAVGIAETLYQRRPDAHLRPIKGYVQIVKLVVLLVAAILIVAVLVDRSPLILLSGIGAMAAVLLLIFQDTLLSLVASVQINSNDMVRIGDWIEMPQLNADGDVIDIALHTVKVQNWDKTITTIPTKRLISDSFKNWRGMQESGGRRIKRSLYLDQASIQFLDEKTCQHLQRFSLLQNYLHDKQAELNAWNAQLAEQGREIVNTRRVTNIGTFRAYVEHYLRSHPHIHQNMTLIVRQLAPTSAGLPLEIYCFTNTTAWVAYEGIQSDIFDHLLAILPEFGLRVFQNPSGADLQSLRPAISPSASNSIIEDD